MSVIASELSGLSDMPEPTRPLNIREKTNQALFSENFRAGQNDKFSRLEKRVEKLTETGGVRIESPFEKEGSGATVEEIYQKEQSALKGCPRFVTGESNIDVYFHYSAYLKDEIEDSPFDHSYSTGTMEV